MTDGHGKSLNERLWVLHHELFYPAFLGAMLFEFAHKFVEDIPHLEPVWVLTALWFVLYFSVAFLALVETNSPKFTPWAFVFNLCEIIVIFAASVWIGLIGVNGAFGFYYLGIYVSWIAIPITGGLSNRFSDRTVHYGLGVAAALVGLVGLVGWVLTYFGIILSVRYGVLLAVMYVLLFTYYAAVFCGLPLLLDRKPAL